MKINLAHTLVVALAASSLLAAPAHAAGASKVVGVWDLVASTPDGDLPSVLAVTEVGAELEAEFTMNGTKQGVTDAKVEGDVFRMTVRVDGVPYKVEVNVDGDTLEGKWSGSEASGTLKGTRQP